MAFQKPEYFTDEELISELQNLGYNVISPNVFQMMKDDLTELIERDLNFSERSIQVENSSSIQHACAQNKYDGHGPFRNFLEKSQAKPFEITCVDTNQHHSHQNSSLVREEDPHCKYQNKSPLPLSSGFHMQQPGQIASGYVESNNQGTGSSPSTNSVARKYLNVSSKYKQSAKLSKVQQCHSPEINADQKFLHSSASNKNIPKAKELINIKRNRSNLHALQELSNFNQIPRRQQEIIVSDQKFSNSLYTNENSFKTKETINKYRSRFIHQSPQEVIDTDHKFSHSSSTSKKISKAKELIHENRSHRMNQSPQEVSADQTQSSKSILKKNTPKVKEPFNKYRNRFKNMSIDNFRRRREVTNSSYTHEFNPVDIEINFPDTESKTLSNFSSTSEKASKNPQNIEINFPDAVSKTSSSFSTSEKNKSPLDSEINFPDVESKTLCSSSTSEKTIKRKVLTHENGRTVITTTFRDIPPVFSTSTTYPETESLDRGEAFSSHDFSPKPNGSTTGLLVSSPNAFAESTSRYASSTAQPLSYRTQCKKKNDPVTRYHYYKKYWDRFKPPGEKSHDKLRWAIRDKMLDYKFH